MRPATTSTQRVDDFHVRVDPEARLQRHLDYFGTEVIEFGVAQPHDHLSIDVRARVVTAEPGEPPDEAWEALEAGSYEAAGGEFLLSDDAEPENGALDELFAASRATSPLATAAAGCASSSPTASSTARARPTSARRSRTCSTPAPASARTSSTSALVLLRRHGIAARYVSGYLWAAPQDGGSDSVEVETHAWLEALLPGGGQRGEPVWVGADPTNRRLAGETHVKIGHGRAYADVPPIKGVYRGPAIAPRSTRAVTMTRLDPQASARA